MAKEKEEETLVSNEVKEVYSEQMTARVNKEGDHHEVILSGEKTRNTLVLRNQPGAKTFRDGVKYVMTFTESE